MEIKRVSEYNKHGCKFQGKLAVIEYLEDAKKDPRWGGFGSGVSMDYYLTALEHAKNELGQDVKVLLGMPELVVSIPWTAEEILEREA